MKKIIVYLTKGQFRSPIQYFVEEYPNTQQMLFVAANELEGASVFTDKCELDRILTTTNWMRDYDRAVEDV